MTSSDANETEAERPAPPVADAPASSSLLPPPETTLPPHGRAASSRPPASSAHLPAAPLSRSLPPLPAVEPILEHAAELRAKGDWDGALEAYKKALFLVDADDHATQASLYAYVGEVKLAQGKSREAETNFEKAIARSPGHLRSLDGLIALATDAREWDRAALFRAKRVEALDDVDARASELCRLAELQEVHLGDVKKAIDTLERAATCRPDDVGILLKLRLLYDRERMWTKLVDVLDRLCRATEKPRERGAHRFAQADVVLARMREEPRGLAFLELALDEDPQNDRALSALVAMRTRREEWVELSYVYERLIDRFAGLGDRERAWEVVKKLATLRRDKLLDGPGALEAFRGAVELRPEDAESRASLAELLAAKGDRDAAARELEIVARYAPFRAQTYRRLYELHSRAQRPDRAWLVATCLEELGASDVAYDLVIEQFRPDGPIRPTTALDASWWGELLRAEGADPIVEDVLRAVGDAAIALRLETLASKHKLPVLDPSAKQDKTSTASVVRTFVWAARALGIGLPDLYLWGDVPSGIAAVPAHAPATALGPEVRSGMTVQQLAFLAGRHLTYYRPEHYALVFFPTLADLSALVLASIRLVIPGISVPPPDHDTPLGDELGDRLTDAQRASLEDAVARLDARGGKLDLLAWIRHVELTAARAGLLLAGDLRVAMRILNDEGETRTIGELPAEKKRGDLLAFCASDAYGVLRERMGVAIHPAALPPSHAKTPTT
jgi:tetratricopeptide (TPR) repeat protein